MIVITDPNYWDCDCDSNYIHKKSESLSCPICNMTEDECSDSRPNEIKLYYKNYFYRRDPRGITYDQTQ